MNLGRAALIDPRLLPLVEPTSEFYANRPAGQGPANMDELLAVRARLANPAAADPPAVEEVASAGGRSVPVRIHEPVGAPSSGVVLQLHGGGFYMGTAAGGDVRNRRLADALGVTVVGVDYRLAPEHPWPAAPDDCETAALWIADHLAERFGTSRFAIGGFSAGSTLAVTTLLRLRDRGVDVVDAAVLQFGTYDLSARTPAGRLIADEFFIAAYAGSAPDRTVPDLSPVYADLTGLPPALMVVGEADVLLADNLAMAAHLSAAGVDVDLRLYPDAPHAFTGHPTPMAQAALDDIDSWLARYLRSPQAAEPVTPGGLARQ